MTVHAAPATSYAEVTADYRDASPGPAKRDGRRQRGVRTHKAILDACRAYMSGGNFRPTVATVAAGAGVSVRTVFDQFGDLDGLYHHALRDDETRRAIRALVLRGNVLIGQDDADRLIHAVVHGRV